MFLKSWFRAEYIHPDLKRNKACWLNIEWEAEEGKTFRFQMRYGSWSKSKPYLRIQPVPQREHRLSDKGQLVNVV
jgi:hypothetical protein